MSSKSGRSLSSRVRLAGFGLAAPFARSVFARFATGFAAALMPGFAFGAMAAFDAFAAVAAFVTMGDDAGRGASEEEDLGNAALRRAARADPEDVTLGSSQKLRSQGTSTRRRDRKGEASSRKPQTVRTAVRQTGDSMPRRSARPEAFIARDAASAAVHIDGNAPRTPRKAHRTRLSRAAWVSVDRGVRATIVR